MGIIILTEGGKEIGFGHITRCRALCEAFEEKGMTPYFIVNADKSAENVLKDKKFTIFNWLEKRDKLLAAITAEDVVVIDSYLAGHDRYDEISRRARGAVYFDDNKRIGYPTGVIVNGSIHAKGLRYPRKRGADYLLGTKYTSLRKEFWDVPKKRVRQHIESIMITFGGDDARNLTPKVLELLNENYPALVKKVVVGSGFKNIAEIKKMSGRNTELIYYPDAERMRRTMLEADIAVSAGGQTLYELARIGVPAVVVGIAENQLNNIAGWKKSGFIAYAGWWEDKGVPAAILRSIRLLQSKAVRCEKSAISRKLVDGKGSLRIRDYLLRKERDGAAYR